MPDTWRCDMLHCEEPGGCLLRTGVVATVGSDTPMPSDNASLIQTQGSQTEPAPKKERPKGSKNSKGGPKVPKVPKVPIVPKVPKVPKVSKGGQVSKVDKPSAEPNSNVASSIELNSNVVPSVEPNSIVAPSSEQSQGTLIDPNLLAELLFTDEVPEMLSERMVCSAPVVSEPVVMVPFLSAVDTPSVSEPTTEKKKKRKAKYELKINVKKANFKTSDRLRTLKTKNVDGAGKDENTPFVIADDDDHEAEARAIDPKHHQE